MLRPIPVLILLLCTVLSCTDASDVIHIIDGDTLDVGEIRVRLHGIDAPEIDQLCDPGEGPVFRCGAWVRRVVADRYEGKRATCEVIEIDRYGRSVATCRVAGEDIGRALVRDGLAFAYRRYSMAYDLEEKQAAAAGRGLHAVSMQSPAQFRAGKRRSKDTPPEGCAIKGNISGNGRIYHMPGQMHYGKTSVNLRNGERWFCSEAEAKAAGWRRARR